MRDRPLGSQVEGKVGGKLEDHELFENYWCHQTWQDVLSWGVPKLNMANGKTDQLDGGSSVAMFHYQRVCK